MRRALAAALAIAALTGCASSARRAKVAATDEISAVQALPARIRVRGTAAPMLGLTVSGTITNADRAPLRCTSIAILVVDERGNAVSPTSQYCDAPEIAPKTSGYFSATFDTQQTENLQLRYEHPDGSYETHDLIVPPA